MSKGHVEIAGAGLAGLTAAAAFAQAGWSVRVHERGDELREIGAGIFLWENSLKVLEAIGAYVAATEGGERDEYWEIRDERQRLLQSGWMMQGSRLITVLRSKLHGALAQAARDAGVEIVTSSPAAGAKADGVLKLVDGRELKADLIIGADGVNSRVRDSLGLASVVTDLQDGCGRYLVRRRPDDIAAKSLEYWKGGRRVGLVPASPESIYVYLCCPANDERAKRAPVDKAEWTKSFPEAAAYIERIDNVGRWAGFSDVVCRRWSHGKVAIIGDAAHAMSPNLGQGAGVAMQSAYALAQIASAADMPASLDAWEQRQRPIVERTQVCSRMYGRIGTRWPQTLLSLRSALVWSIGKSSWAQRYINLAAHSAI